MSISGFSTVDLIAARDDSVNAAFMDFNQAVENNPGALFVFYEGYDNDYYYPRIERYGQLPVEPIKCKGKTKVIRLYKFLQAKPEYAKYRKGFFVDKDFDMNQDAVLADFYVTSGYSVENYYTSELCMERILKQMFNFHTGDMLLEELVADYRELCTKYHEAILLFNSWYCALRRKYGNLLSGICLDDKMPKGFVKCDFASKRVDKCYGMEDIDSKFCTTSFPLVAIDLNNAEEYIRQNPQKYLRGKYCIHFLYGYLMSIQEKFKKDATFAAHKRNILISPDNIMLLLSPYADTEQELINYIRRIAA